MKKRIFWSLLFVILLITLNANAKTANEIFNTVSSSIVVIQTYDSMGKTKKFGSGVVISNGTVATNYHVIENAAQIKVFYKKAVYVATQLYSDEDRDVCILVVTGLKAPAVILGKTSLLKVGSRIYAIGAPQGMELTLSDGLISSLRPVADGQYIQITAPISHGSSGGGLFDTEGRLIGLTTFYLKESQQLNFAVPVEWISDLAKSKVSSQKPKSGSEFTDSSTGMKFVFVKGGCFEMGDTLGDGFEDEKPVHIACVSDFYLGKYEVTVGQYRKFVQETHYRTDSENRDGCLHGSEWRFDENISWRTPGFIQDDNHPVVCVSWNDAQAFIQWLNNSGGKSYRLPTEAEWEYSARSKGKTEKYAGTNNGDELGEYAWYNANSGNHTHPVGQKTQNSLGLYDMTGNAWEWCQDWFAEDYYSRSPRNNPSGPPFGSSLILRGGSWYSDQQKARVTVRSFVFPTARSINFNGFRLAISAR